MWSILIYRSFAEDYKYRTEDLNMTFSAAITCGKLQTCLTPARDALYK